MRISAYLTAAVTALAAAGCGAPGGRDQQAVPPELRLEEVRFRIYRGDHLRAHGKAASASLRRDSSELHAQEVDAALPRGSGTPVRFAAPVGGGSVATRQFEATGGVVVSRGADEARTERARFEPATEGEDRDGLVLGDDPVTVSGRGYRLTGNGFTLDPDAGTIVVRGRASLVAGLPEVRR